MLRIVNVAGARPNFVKIAPLVAEFRKHPAAVESILVHTGQHYDEALSDAFFRDLDIPRPDIHLNVGSASHAQQTAEIMKRFEPVLIERRPDFVLVVGDVNSTIACALAAAKLQIKVIHVEAGLRSFDRRMPGEINRVLTDHIADILFVTEESGLRNLVREGIAAEKIHFVGNVMIDSLQRQITSAEQSDALERFGLAPQNYGLVTLHRPSNVDDRPVFQGILEALGRVAERLPVLFPIHPRSESRVRAWKLESCFAGAMDGKPKIKGLFMVPPIGYLDFLKLMKHARLVLTDSGGVQEETTVLGIPCLTLRRNTERPSTIEMGTNKLVGIDPEMIVHSAVDVLEHGCRARSFPPLWDGKAAERIVKILLTQRG